MDALSSSAGFHVPFAPRGSTVSGTQTSDIRMGRENFANACSQRSRDSYAPKMVNGPADMAPGHLSCEGGPHNTHAHSALAVTAEASRENATSSEALRASRIIACPPRRSSLKGSVLA
jgi:hypothetical protein